MSSVVTIGMYDGVHRGHQAVLAAARAEADARGIPLIVMTFDPHPVKVHRPDAYLTEVTTLEHRIDLLRDLGVDEVDVVPYSLGFAAQSPREFVQTYLLERLAASCVVEGEDVRFGAGNAGDAQCLASLGADLGFDVRIVSDLHDPKTGRRWSSTWVREALLAGDVREAAYVLGRPHRVRGEVEHGLKRGRELGFPTANVHAKGVGVVPADGVYAGWLVLCDNGVVRPLPAAISVGTNPHFDGERRTVEAHVLGRSDLNIYGQTVQVEFTERIRAMASFDSLDALLAEMDRDLATTARILGVPSASRVDPASVTAK
ncbi:riboflavin biosynthesis protein RibF [Bowdeniella nasicola]|uniref:Riboflavin biosynthesis protein n=1 Tax=Bowdeniella nasicola TaxID=208480 RepID=A0A1Q5Q5Q3_9ACTO|nr:bifunctional riboflavin kinase/FAD synthetase [Bowdeniella nasicola]OKL55157.1 riboflavin biosynthesis protein RibF [Bowdeniella nasicola]